MIKTIIFDFDGVVVESANIKTEAFREMFEKEYPDQVEDIVNYHIMNMGISRFVKFKYIYEKMLKKPLSDTEMNKLGEIFSGIVLNKVLNAPFVTGVMDFLERFHNRYFMFICSGTPQDEMDHIINKRNLLKYFKEIHGSPKKKLDIISDILTRYQFKTSEVIYVGDALTDLEAAQKADVFFIARITDDNNIEQLNRCEYKIKDFVSFENIPLRLK